MRIDLVGRPKRADVTHLGRGAAEIIDANFQRLAVDVRAIVTALRAYKIDLGSDDDVTGALDISHLLGVVDAINAAILAAFVPAGVSGDVQINSAGHFAGRPLRSLGHYSPLSVKKCQGSAPVMTHAAPELVFTTAGDTVMVWSPAS